MLCRAVLICLHAAIQRAPHGLALMQVVADNLLREFTRECLAFAVSLLSPPLAIGAPPRPAAAPAPSGGASTGQAGVAVGSAGSSKLGAGKGGGRRGDRGASQPAEEDGDGAGASQQQQPASQSLQSQGQGQPQVQGATPIFELLLSSEPVAAQVSISEHLPRGLCVLPSAALALSCRCW